MNKEAVNEDISAWIISLEKQAMEIWNNGNPDAFLELSDDDVVYFDPSLDRKLEGLEALKEYYDKARGTVHVDWYEMINQTVQATEDMAVLTYNHNCTADGTLYNWNRTEVYRRNQANEWKIIQTHWSYIKPLS